MLIKKITKFRKLHFFLNKRNCCLESRRGVSMYNIRRIYFDYLDYEALNEKKQNFRPTFECEAGQRAPIVMSHILDVLRHQSNV